MQYVEDCKERKSRHESGNKMEVGSYIADTIQLPRPLGASNAENDGAVEGPVGHGVVEEGAGGDTGAYSRGE